MLGAGTWDITSTISLGVSGVVLQGAAGGVDTILSALEVGHFSNRRGPYTPPVVRVGGLDQPSIGTNPSGKTPTMTPTAITSSRVPVGAKTFVVADASELSAGDAIMVHWIAADAFTAATGTDNIPNCNGGCNDWTATEYNIQFRRTITSISGNTVTIDVPLTQAITLEHSNSVVWKYDDPNRVVLSGVRDITFRSEFSDGAEDETHAWNAVSFEEIKHGFAQNLHCHQFAFFCVGVLREATHVTTKDCTSVRTQRLFVLYLSLRFHGCFFPCL